MIHASKISVVVASVLAGFLAAACQTSNTTGRGTDMAAASGGLKIGTLLPTTGDLSSIGQNMPVAAKLAVETVNECGGVNEQSVTLINEDSQTDPNSGAAAMSKLAEADRVAAVVGAFASSVSSAAVDVAVRNQVMFVSPGSTSPVFTERAKKGEFNGYWARTAPPDTYQAQALAKLAKQRGFERVSTIAINNDYGVGFEQVFVQSFKELGGEVVNDNNPVRYDPKATTLDSEAAAAFEGNPGAVVSILYAETGSLLLKSAYQQGLMENSTVMLTDAVKSEKFTKQVGQTRGDRSLIAGALGTVPGADGEALSNFTSLWKEETGKEVTAFVPHTWDATVLTMLAAEAADQNTGSGIKSQIRAVSNSPGQQVSDVCQALELVRNGKEINYQGASGNVNFDENGDVVGSYDVWTVKKDGSINVIDQVGTED